jgi:hypothetical protein
MKRKVLPLLICLLPIAALAQTVYESKDNEGPVFSDTPTPGAQPIDLPPPNVIDTPTPVQQQSQSTVPVYTSFTILSPQGQGTVHTNTGRFQVNLALSPALQGGNAIRVSLDESQLPTLRYTLQFNITSDEWQSFARDNVLHQLQVAIVDDSGNVLFAADPVQFYVHRSFRDTDTHQR